MLTVSEAALQKFDDTITTMSESPDDGLCLRMVRSEESGLALSLEPAQSADTTFEYEGRTVLAVPDAYADFCDDKQLDLDESGSLTLV
jgi:hypothetical protein